MTNHDDTKATPEQVAYANLLFWGAWAGIAIMTVTYAIYLAGIIDPHVPINMVTQNWGKGVDEYLHLTGSPHGWGWAALLGTGDFMNFLGIALLALLTIVCYFILVKAYFANGDRVYGFIAVAEILVLAAAASGLLGSGGH